MCITEVNFKVNFKGINNTYFLCFQSLNCIEIHNHTHVYMRNEGRRYNM